MGDTKDANRRRRLTIAIVVGAATVLAAAVGSFAPSLWDRWIAGFCSFRYEIDTPEVGAQVFSTAGFEAKGTVQNLPAGQALWILDRDTDGFTVDEKQRSTTGHGALAVRT